MTPGTILLRRQEHDWPPEDDQSASLPATGEGALVVAVLDRQREALAGKLDGLDEDQVRRQLPTSSLSLLSLIKHVTMVEIVLFQLRFAGSPPPGVALPIDWDASWRLDPDDTIERILAGYADAVAHSRRLVGPEPDLATPARDPGDQAGMTLRWIMLHMIEETARHIGHADLLRFAIEHEIRL